MHVTLDHHQRSRYVTIGLEVKFHWAPQLNNNQKEKLFDSHKKKLPDEQNSSNQPNQRHEWTKELGSKIVQQPEGETVRQPEGEVDRRAKLFQKTQSVIDQGNLISRKT